MAMYREIFESPLIQGSDEAIAYTLTTTPWGTSPANVAVKLYEWNAETQVRGTDVSLTNLTGAAAVVGDVITLPVITGLTPEKTYRMEIKFTVSGNVMETYGFIYAEQ